MTCPHCGASMKEEQVFCETCGRERQLVPVFDAEIDATLQDTMSIIVDDLANTQEIVPTDVAEELRKAEEKAIADRITEEENEKNDTSSVRSGSSHLQIVLYVVAALVAVILLVMVVLVLSTHKEDSSYEHQMKMAEQMELEGNFDQMLHFAKKAATSAPNSSDAKMMLARAYDGLGETDLQMTILEQLLETDHAYIPAYDMLIELYEEQKMYEEIGRLLSECKEQEVLDHYVSFQSAPPAMSENEGSYHEIISLKLIAPGKGDVYYTLDGTDPYENGQLYMTPIILGPGDYKVSAYYRNQYGINSDVVSARYQVEVETLEDPFVALEAGFYDQPQLITVDNPSNKGLIYYTTNGQEPTTQSNLYERPIPLPLGESEFSFALYDEDEKISETVHVEYNFVPDIAITLDQIKNMLIQALVQNQTLLDAGGHIPEADGYRDYKVYSATDYEGNFCFLISEEYVSPEGSVQKTGKIYAVNAQTGVCYEAIQNQLGLFEMNKI